jgi:hypothetical protein
VFDAIDSHAKSDILTVQTKKRDAPAFVVAHLALSSKVFLMQVPLTLRKHGICHLWITFLLLALNSTIRAQSRDMAAPSPVRSNDIVGTIAARDLGDARLTDHFYALSGTPGDLVITLESTNLNGDIDIFTAAGLRPLLKFTVYAESSLPISKRIYLRKRERLILRVEARSPNDDEGTYHLRFGGSFEPISGGPLLAENGSATEQPAASSSRPGGKQGRRVSSVGARIAEPTPTQAEVAAAPTPEPTPAESATATAKAEPKKKPAAAPKATANRNARSRVPARPRTGKRTTGAAKKSTEEAKEESNPVAAAKEKPAEVSEPESKPVAASRKAGRKSAVPRPAAKPPAETKPEIGPRLIIETREGTLINRFMNTVRRVTVENGQIVVVGKDGRTQRVQMAAVVRMSIEP